MELRKVPKPELRPGTVVVKNRVIALNYGDVFFIKGQYLVKPVFPDIPGMEAAGIIEAVAPDVAGLRPGMRVAYIGMGAYCGVHTVSLLAGHFNSRHDDLSSRPRRFRLRC